jgi:phosphoglycolate phosphatase-like HAD superfamily hydrolase
MAEARFRFVERLTAALDDSPTRFTSIAGAPIMLRQLVERGWSVAVATGGWGPSAQLKLRVAELAIDDAVFACADDARSRADIVQLARERAEAFYQRRFDRVVSVGDGVWDVETAIVLGLPFVGIATGARADRLRGAGGAVLPDYSNLDGGAALDTATAPSSSSHHPRAGE